MRYKIFNFNQLSDNGATMTSNTLTAAQILGDAEVWFNYSLADIPEKYWFARRLYYELDFTHGPTTTAIRGFVDAPTRVLT